MKRLLNIRRIDNAANRTYAWLVRVQRNGQIAIKMFSDAVHGGKRKALQAAISHRDRCVVAMTPPEYPLWRRTVLRRNNRSGIPGVSRHDNIDNPRTGHRRIIWLAAWTDEHDVPRRRSFSVLRYGEQGAKRLAIAERKRRLKEVCIARYG